MIPGPGTRRRSTAAMSSILTWATDLISLPAEHSGREGPYAQFSEDRILNHIFRNTPRGHCVEVGAYDGRTGSATYLFEQQGWHCLLIEPIPDACTEIRRHRHCTLKACAASSREGQATLFVAASVEQMSTLDLTRRHYDWIRQVGGNVTPITVRTARLDTLLAEAGFSEIDFITIDVEGHELEVLRGFSLHKYSPRILIIESNSEESTSMIARYMAKAGYINFRRTGVNDWYAHNADAELVRADELRRFRRDKKKRRLRTQITRRLPLWAKRGLRNILGSSVSGR